MEKYVKAIVGKFANDKRIVLWDVWNEPDNMTGPSYEKVEVPNKVELVLPLLKKHLSGQELLIRISRSLQVYGQATGKATVL